MIEYLIKTYSNENDLVLDNCCGSGGVGVACIKNNRNYILIENDINFYNLTKKELKLCSNVIQSEGIMYLSMGNWPSL